jgi:hypothetical protein
MVCPAMARRSSHVCVVCRPRHQADHKAPHHRAAGYAEGHRACACGRIGSPVGTLPSVLDGLPVPAGLVRVSSEERRSSASGPGQHPCEAYGGAYDKSDGVPVMRLSLRCAPSLS